MVSSKGTREGMEAVGGSRSPGL
ncbi:MAG: hypothetical protein U7123_18015 [Potamolinea sp.]